MKNGRYEAHGISYWYLNNELHIEDGPAVEQPGGIKSWFLNGKSHREDGPAYENKDGTKKWFLNGVELNEEQFNQCLDKNSLNEKLQSFPSKPTEKRSKI